jgi:triacylglycerol lipase
MKLVAWLAGALTHWDGPAGPPNPDATPVILVHGIYSSAADMTRIANQLRKTGRKVFTPSLEPANGSATLDTLAAQLAAFADREVPDGKFDLVGFSMGGLVSRYYVQRLGGLDRVGRFVTLATPHNGTVMAHLFRGAGHLQMRPGSSFLRDLDADADVLKRVGFTSLYTPLDTIIVPAKSSEQFAATNIKVWGVMHPSFVLEKRCINAVADSLK